MTQFFRRSLLIGLLLLGMLLSAGGLAFALAENRDAQPTRVVVSVEGFTLGHGFYIEPTIVTFDEFIGYWAEKGQTVSADDITAGGILSYVLQKNGTPIEESVSGPGYLAGIAGIRKGKGDAVVPDCLADNGITVTQEEGDDLFQRDYTMSSGWMFTDGTWMSNQSLASHTFSGYGMPYTDVYGEGYYVLRLQFSIAGLGADLGFTEWGTSYGYEAADKGDLYGLYALLKEEGILQAGSEAEQRALAVMTKLNATQEETDAAQRELLEACQFPVPVFVKDLPADPVNYAAAGQAASPLEISVNTAEGTLRYQWYTSADRYSWEPIPGAESPSYTPDVSAEGTAYYKCTVVHEEEGKIRSRADSTIASVIVGKMPNTPMLIDDLEDSQTYALNAFSPKPLSVDAWTMGGSGKVQYQWYQGKPGVASIDAMEPIAGATGAEYVPDVSEERQTVYACRVWYIEGENKVFADSTLCTVTVSSEVILISTEEELNILRTAPDGRYKLANDIQLTQPWVPVTGFSGTLDGDGHVISGLQMEHTGMYGGGFFSYTLEGALIQNLGVEGKVSASQMSSTGTGGLSGAIFGETSILNCYTDVDIKVSNNYAPAGGLVGSISGGVAVLIQNCYFVGTVENVYEGYAGGLVGRNDSGAVVVKNCYTTSDIAIGSYGSVQNADQWNNYCASADDAHAKQIADKGALADLLNTDANDRAWAADTENRNDGYPVLSWQASTTDSRREQKIGELLAAIDSLYKGSGDDWHVIAMMARGYSADLMDRETLKRNAEEVAADARAASTDYERVAIALTAAGFDASDFALADGTRFNFIEKIANFRYNNEYDLGTVNGYIFALIAYNSGAYALPQDARWTEDAIIAYLSSVQGNDGGWSLFADINAKSDVDLTAMAITALVPYQANPIVGRMLDKSVAFLSGAQTPNGGFSSIEGENSNSAAQVLLALAALDIDPNTDARFIKGDNTVLDALLSYATDDLRLGFTDNAAANDMSTLQGFLAFTAYNNWLTLDNGAYNVYDFAGNSNPDRGDAVDKSVLEGLIGQAEALQGEGYTADSWNSLQEALSAAKTVMGDPEAAQAEVYQAAARLQQALNGLQQGGGQEGEPSGGGCSGFAGGAGALVLAGSLLAAAAWLLRTKRS